VRDTGAEAGAALKEETGSKFRYRFDEISHKSCASEDSMSTCWTKISKQRK
jgi:hypothetical protein